MSMFSVLWKLQQDLPKSMIFQWKSAVNAALFHDIAKYMDKESLGLIMEKEHD